MNAILALATPPTPATRAILRLSGPDLLGREGLCFAEAWGQTGLTGLQAWDGRRGVLAGSWRWAPGVELPLQFWCFPGPASATGEDVVEIHLPGNPVAVQQLQERLLRIPGMRAAEPGEFTRRAFLHGKLDLTQVEAVLDLVHARNAAQARAATAVLAGGLGRDLQQVRDALRDALVQIEAGLDFEEGDSQDLRPGEVSGFLEQAITALQRGINHEAQFDFEHAGVVRIGLLGAPNAGKSALFQWLTGQQVLVSDVRGTTRDRLEAEWRAQPESDLRWRLADGPGRSDRAVDARDREAQRRAAADAFDLQWWVVDAAQPASVEQPPLPGLPTVVVLTKADLPRALTEPQLASLREVGDCVWVSTKQQSGAQELAAATAELVEQADSGQRASARAHARHALALRDARESIEAAQALDQIGGHQDLVAEDLRRALQAIAELVGELTPEELLDHVFSSFCIGK